ncbi:MAG: sulfatase-like hydrolase/transferase, partial [Planctomycetota bacterium]|nr:sulfatase-like hydrolase/transferase [Planctomycetota bacterium]
MSTTKTPWPALALFATLGGCGHAGGAEASGPSVLVVAIDGLRADHVGCYGYDLPTTPTLDQLAADGVAFSEAFSTAPLPLPAHVSLLTGCDPNVARRLGSTGEMERWRVPHEVPRLAVSFLRHGYATAAFLDHELLAERLGLGSGFQRYEVTDSARENELDGVGIGAIA